MNNLRKIKSRLTIIAVAAMLFSIVYLNTLNAAMLLNAAPENDTATLRFRVTDGQERRALPGAKVIIPEINRSFVSDGEGYTPYIEVPVLTDNNGALQRDGGELTVIAHCEGYIDYVLLHMNVPYGIRDNIPVRLYRRTDKDYINFMVFSESPDDTWIQKLIDKYKKP